MSSTNSFATWRQLFAAAAIVNLVIASGGGNVALAASSRHVEPLTSRPHKAACATPAPGRVRCLAQVSTQSAANPAQAASPAAGPFGYSPTDFHTAYQLPCAP